MGVDRDALALEDHGARSPRSPRSLLEQGEVDHDAQSPLGHDAHPHMVEGYGVRLLVDHGGYQVDPKAHPLDHDVVGHGVQSPLGRDAHLEDRDIHPHVGGRGVADHDFQSPLSHDAHPHVVEGHGGHQVGHDAHPHAEDRSARTRNLLDRGVVVHGVQSSLGCDVHLEDHDAHLHLGNRSDHPLVEVDLDGDHLVVVEVDHGDRLRDREDHVAYLLVEDLEGVGRGAFLVDPVAFPRHCVVVVDLEVVDHGASFRPLDP